MAIAFRAFADNAQTTATTITTNMPSGTAAGDVVIVFAASDATTDRTITENSGTWSSIADLFSNDNRDTNLGVFYKVMGGTPDTNVQINFSGAASNLVSTTVAYSGVDPTTPLDVTSVTNTGTNTAQVNSNAIVSVTNNAMLISGGASSVSSPTLFTQPSGYTYRNVRTNGIISVVVSDKVKTPAGSDDAANWTISPSGTQDSYSAVAIALRPFSGNYVLSADPGSYTVTGVAATIAAQRVVNAEPGSYSVSGVAAILAKGFSINAQAGSYSVTGNDVTDVIARGMNAQSGSYSVTGIAATEGAQRNINAGPGSYSVTGTAATDIIARGMTAAAGSYSVSGQAATIAAQRNINAGPGSYSVTGAAATTTKAYILVADPGSYGLIGFAAELSHPTGTTWNPSDIAASITLTNSNLTAEKNAGDSFASGRSTTSKTAGAYVFECTADQFTATFNYGFGLMPADASLTGYVGLENDSVGYYHDGSVYLGNALVNTLPSYSPTDVLTCFHNFSTGKGWFAKNGTLSSGDPAAGTGEHYSFSLVDPIFAAFTTYDGTGTLDKWTGNFGATSFVSSIPSGFVAWDGAALNHYVLNAEAGIYSVTGSDATLLRTYLLNAGPGSYAVTGVDATLIYTAGGVVAAVIPDNFSFGMGPVGKMRVHPHPTHSRIKQ